MPHAKVNISITGVGIISCHDRMKPQNNLERKMTHGFRVILKFNSSMMDDACLQKSFNDQAPPLQHDFLLWTSHYTACSDLIFDSDSNTVKFSLTILAFWPLTMMTFNMGLYVFYFLRTSISQTFTRIPSAWWWYELMKPTNFNFHFDVSVISQVTQLFSLLCCFGRSKGRDWEQS